MERREGGGRTVDVRGKVRGTGQDGKRFVGQLQDWAIDILCLIV